MAKRHVLGFRFGKSAIEQGNVVLIEKQRPKWQEGLLNGIGGKIEEGETPIEALLREYHEEAGIYTQEDEWTHTAYLHGEDWDVEVFASKGVIHGCRAMTDEQIVVAKVDSLRDYPNLIPNLHWLIPLCLNVLNGQDENLIEASAHYGSKIDEQ